jgi:hypothetical protein
MPRTSANLSINWDEHLAAEARLCLFIGAGVSAGCKTDSGHVPPAWDALIDQLAELYGLDPSTSSSLGLLERAELVERKRVELGINDHDFAVEVAKRVDFISDEYVNHSKVHETVSDLEPRLIITTNYDRTLERYLNGTTDVGFNVWAYPGRIDQLTANCQCTPNDKLGDLIRSGSPLIVKLHGGVPDIGPNNTPSADPNGGEDLVFSYRSYRTAYGPSSEIPAFLRAVFVNYQVIFIGYSLRDEVLKDILDSVGSLKGDRFRHIVLQKSDSVVPKVYREAFEDAYGVVVADYSDHELLAASLHGVKLAQWTGAR